MSTLPIRIYGDAILRKKAKPVKHIDGQLQRLIVQMTETMLAAEAPPAVGLAAPQVGRLMVRRGANRFGRLPEFPYFAWYGATALAGAGGGHRPG